MGYTEAVIITLDKPRPFLVSFGTIRRFQKATGRTFKQLVEMMGQIQEDDSVEDEVLDMLGQLVWAGCVADDPSLTVDFIFDNLAMDPTEQLTPVFDAIARAVPNADDSPLANGTQKNPKETVGVQSGPLPESNSTSPMESSGV